MKLDYFKHGLLGDCYAPKGNFKSLIILTKSEIGIDSDFDNLLEGAYKTLQITNSDYKELQKAAKNKDRKKGLTLINKLHELNKKVLSSPLFFVKVEDFRKELNPNISFELVNYFTDKKPILN